MNRTEKQLAMLYRRRMPAAGPPSDRDLLLMGMGRRSAQVRARVPEPQHPDLPGYRAAARWLAGRLTEELRS